MDVVQPIESKGETIYWVSVPCLADAVAVSADFVSVEPAGVLAFYVKSFHGERRLVQAYAGDQWLKLTTLGPEGPRGMGAN